eukprot:403343697
MVESQSLYLNYLAKTLLGIGSLTIAALGALYLKQNSLIYHPAFPVKSPSLNPFGLRLPSDRGLLYKDIETVTSDGVKLKGWFIHQKNPIDAPTIIFMHENAGNIGQRLQYFQYIYSNLDVNIVTLGYRGYSDSDGTPSEQGIKLDAKAIVEHVLKMEEVDNDKLFLLGRSIGGAVAIYTASQYPDTFRGLIIENSFTSMGDMVDSINKYLGLVKGLVLRNYWNSIDLVENLKLPILFVHGNKDELVPCWMGEKLHDNSKNSVEKKKYIVEGGTHNDTWYVGQKEYLEELLGFINMAQCYKLPNYEAN